jgi:probable phosphoglycerate mutase
VDSSLNNRGREQAALFHAAYGAVEFEHVHVSALRRTHETAAPFVEAGFSWSAHPELDEIAWGEQEGKKASEGMKRRYRKILDGWSQGQLDVALPGGESPLDVAERMNRFLDAHIRPALQTPADQNTDAVAIPKRLVVSHGRAMRVLLCLLMQQPLTYMEQYSHGNLGLYRLAWDGSRFRLEDANNNDHLSSLQHG